MLCVPQGVRLIVFPEWGLHGLMSGLDVGDEDMQLLHRGYAAYTEEIPDCIGQPGCCFGTRGAINYSVVETVARLARRYDMCVTAYYAH